jgi:hypothetical protein
LHYLLTYAVVSDYVTRRAPLRAAHIGLGLVTSWRVREWTMVVGKDAAVALPDVL